MAAYVIAEVEVTNPAVMEEYRKLVPATIAEYGGRFLVRGGRTETLEGDWAPPRLVIIEFESVERAKDWWSSESYRLPKAMRQSAGKTQLLVIEGI